MGATTVDVDVIFAYPHGVQDVKVHVGSGGDMVDAAIYNASVLNNANYGLGNFSAHITDLIPNTTYYYYYEYINGPSSQRSEVKSFTTLSSAEVSIHDYLAISDGIYYYFSPSANVKNYYFRTYADDKLPSSDDAIVSDLKSNGLEMKMKIDGGNEGYSYNLKVNTKYTACVVSFDASNKQGVLVKKEIYTKPSTNQPLITIAVNSISGSSITCSTVKNGYCSSYVLRGNINLPDDHLSRPDIYWAAKCYDDYKLSKNIHTQNYTNVTWNGGFSNSCVVYTLGFSSSGVNSGVISKQFFNTNTESSALAVFASSGVTSTSQSYTSLAVSATISDNGGSEVTERGFCWSTTTNPTISNSKVSLGLGTGSFSTTITGLTSGTTYYVRAYATNAAGISYTGTASFATYFQPTYAVFASSGVTCTSKEFTSISNTSLTLSANISSNGGSVVTSRGFCWSQTRVSPEIGNSDYVVVGSGNGTFSSTITGLRADALFYVRAFAVNSVGVTYTSSVLLYTPKN